MGRGFFATADHVHVGRTNRAAGDGSGGGQTGREAKWMRCARCVGLNTKRGTRIIETMPLYTGAGDHGETSFFDGAQVSKADVRVAAYGEVDELNTTLGMAVAFGLDADLREIVVATQRHLFALGARLADPGSRIASRVAKANITEADVKQLERWIDDFDATLPELKSFILPGGGRAGASLHLARTVCRRAERCVVALGVDLVEPLILRYVNRLSDLLFVLGRAANHRAEVAEVEW